MLGDAKRQVGRRSLNKNVKIRVKAGGFATESFKIEGLKNKK